MSNLAFFATKLVAGSTITGFVIATPFSLSSVSSNQEVAQTNFPVVEKVNGKDLSSSSKGGPLSLENLDEVMGKIQKRGDTISFKEVGMKFGGHSLSEGDLLVSPEQNGKYYLAKPTNNLRNQYKLGNGQVVGRFYKGDLDWKNLDHVELDWQQWYHVGRTTLSTIAVGSCNFTRLNESEFFIRCNQFFDGKKGSGETVQSVFKLNK